MKKCVRRQYCKTFRPQMVLMSGIHSFSILCVFQKYNFFSFLCDYKKAALMCSCISGLCDIKQSLSCAKATTNTIYLIQFCAYAQTYSECTQCRLSTDREMHKIQCRSDKAKLSRAFCCCVVQAKLCAYICIFDLVLLFFN